MTIWVVAIILQRSGNGVTEYTQTLSWREHCSEEEAKRQAVSFAQRKKPGFSVVMVTTGKIEVPIEVPDGEEV